MLPIVGEADRHSTVKVPKRALEGRSRFWVRPRDLLPLHCLTPLCHIPFDAYPSTCIAAPPSLIEKLATQQLDRSLNLSNDQDMYLNFFLFFIQSLCSAILHLNSYPRLLFNFFVVARLDFFDSAPKNVNFFRN